MTLQELHKKLQEIGVDKNDYYLHGLYGSLSDDDKQSMIMKKGKYGIEYVVYFRERGVINSEKIFFTEDDACQYFFRREMITIDVKNGKYSQ